MFLGAVLLWRCLWWPSPRRGWRGYLGRCLGHNQGRWTLSLRYSLRRLDQRVRSGDCQDEHWSRIPGGSCYRSGHTYRVWGDRDSVGVFGSDKRRCRRCCRRSTKYPEGNNLPARGNQSGDRKLPLRQMKPRYTIGLACAVGVTAYVVIYGALQGGGPLILAVLAAVSLVSGVLGMFLTSWLYERLRR